MAMGSTRILYPAEWTREKLTKHGELKLRDSFIHRPDLKLHARQSTKPIGLGQETPSVYLPLKLNSYKRGNSLRGLNISVVKCCCCDNLCLESGGNMGNRFILVGSGAWQTTGE